MNWKSDVSLSHWLECEDAQAVVNVAHSCSSVVQETFATFAVRATGFRFAPRTDLGPESFLASELRPGRIRTTLLCKCLWSAPKLLVATINHGAVLEIAMARLVIDTRRGFGKLTQKFRDRRSGLR